VIITETTKPHVACVRNLGARAKKMEPGLNSTELGLPALDLPALHLPIPYDQQSIVL